MDRYYINNFKDANGNNEVHKESCYWLSLITSKSYLGYFSGGVEAVKRAKEDGIKADGCIHCCLEAHKG